MVTWPVVQGPMVPCGLLTEKQSWGSIWKSYATCTSLWFCMYSTRVAVLPAATLPKLNARAEKVTVGPSAVPRRLSETRLPPAVDSVKFSHEKVPVCLGV